MIKCRKHLNRRILFKSFEFENILDKGYLTQRNGSVSIFFWFNSLNSFVSLQTFYLSHKSNLTYTYMNLSIKIRWISLSVDFSHKMVVYWTKKSNEIVKQRKRPHTCIEYNCEKLVYIWHYETINKSYSITRIYI